MQMDSEKNLQENEQEQNKNNNFIIIEPPLKSTTEFPVTEETDNQQIIATIEVNHSDNSDSDDNKIVLVTKEVDIRPQPNDEKTENENKIEEKEATQVEEKNDNRLGIEMEKPEVNNNIEVVEEKKMESDSKNEKTSNINNEESIKVIVVEKTDEQKMQTSLSSSKNEKSDEEMVKEIKTKKAGDFKSILFYNDETYPKTRDEGDFRRIFSPKYEKTSKIIVFEKIIEAATGLGVTFNYLYYSPHASNENIEELQKILTLQSLDHVDQGEKETQIMREFGNSPYFVHVFQTHFSTFSQSVNEAIADVETNTIIKDEIRWLRIRTFLEYCEKGPLENHLNESCNDPNQRYKWYMQALLGIKQMHQHEISHHDIKPLNFLITNHNDCKVADFGAVKSKQRNIEGNEATLLFAAPEYLRQEQYNEYKYDVYSLGNTFWLMLEGESLYEKLSYVQEQLMNKNNELSNLPDIQQCKLFQQNMNSLERLLLLGMTTNDPNKRFTIDQCIMIVECLINHQNESNEIMEIMEIINNPNYQIEVDKLSNLIVLYAPKNDLITYVDPPLSKSEKFVHNFGRIIGICMVIVWIVLISIAIVQNKKESASASTVIGYTILNMIIGPIFMIIFALMIIKAWKVSTWRILLFIIYLSLLIDVFSLSGHILKALLILYGVVKIPVFGLSYMFAKIDRFYLPEVIKESINMKFLKQDSGVFDLWKWFGLCLSIQVCIFVISCTALININSLNDLTGVRVAAFIFTIWIINVPRHFLHYVGGRMITNYLEQTQATNRVQDAIQDAKNKMTTIVIGSFLVSFSPFWNFMANLMWLLKYVGNFFKACGTDNKRRNDDGCICSACCYTVGFILSAISQLLEKFSKFVLSLTSKSILTIASINNLDYFNAVKTQRATLEKSKELFTTKMVFLDNAMLQNVTHLCIICSSIGCWLAISIDESIAFIVWLAGYSACRTVFELVDTTIQYFLIAWNIRPDLMYQLTNSNLIQDYQNRNKELQNALDNRQPQPQPQVQVQAQVFPNASNYVPQIRSAEADPNSLQYIVPNQTQSMGYYPTQNITGTFPAVYGQYDSTPAPALPFQQPQ